MGDNPLERCYIVGYSEISAKFPHHRAASGLTKCEDPDEHRYILYGALVGGPDGQDNHNDTTADWIYNEVTIDYNAAFVGACAGLYEYYGTADMKPVPDFPPYVEAEAGGNSFWVDAYAVDDMQVTTTAGVTKLAIQVRTDSISPKTDLSIRYFFSIEEMSDPANISMISSSELYDQTAVEAQPYDGIISQPIQYDASFDPNIYYIEVKWDGYKIANSNKKYQFLVGLYYGDTWDPTNDWSYQGITKCADTYQDGSETRTDYICVYSDGVLVGGIEPDGSVPEVPETEETTTTPATTTTAPVENTLYGDVNLDNTVSVSDLVLLARYVAQDKDISTFTAQQTKNADCNSDGALGADDVSFISLYLAGMMTNE